METIESIEQDLQKQLTTVHGQIAQLEAALQQANDMAQQVIGGIKLIQRLKASTTKAHKEEAE